MESIFKKSYLSVYTPQWFDLSISNKRVEEAEEAEEAEGEFNRQNQLNL
jgi:hypothetical protein